MYDTRCKETKLMKHTLISITRINHHYHLLSNAEKRIADYIIENHQVMGDVTSQGLAEVTGTSAATVVRFCRSIGYKSFVEFRMHLKHELISPTANWYEVDSNESIAMIKQKSFNFNKNSMDETLAVLDDEALERAVHYINEASAVIIIGEGGSGSTARAAYDAFLQLGIPARLIEDPFFQILAVSHLNPDDNAVVCGFSHSGMSRNVYETIKLAHDRKLTTIGFVGITGAPLTRYLDITLHTGVSNHPYFSDTLSARICELNVVSAIHAALSIIKKEELGDFREEIAKLLSIKRVKK